MLNSVTAADMAAYEQMKQEDELGLNEPTWWDFAEDPGWD